MKPLIGVMPLWDEEKDSLWMLPGYLDGLRQAGATPIVFPLTADPEEISRLVGLCDGILLTGGQDVSPRLYGEAQLDVVDCCELRDNMDAAVLRAALAQGKPILGICRGLQFVNVFFGGTLWQDLPTQHPSEVSHRQKPPYNLPAHTVSIAPNAPLAACLPLDELPVNSCHHQAIRELAPRLKPMATAPDGLIEAVWLPDYPFLWAVQWHPEFCWQTDQTSQRIFKAFADAAAEEDPRHVRKKQ